MCSAPRAGAFHDAGIQDAAVFRRRRRRCSLSPTLHPVSCLITPSDLLIILFSASRLRWLTPPLSVPLLSAPQPRPTRTRMRTATLRSSSRRSRRGSETSRLRTTAGPRTAVRFLSTASLVARCHTALAMRSLPPALVPPSCVPPGTGTDCACFSRKASFDVCVSVPSSLPQTSPTRPAPAETASGSSSTRGSSGRSAPTARVRAKRSWNE